jgi:hypothetical protein
MHIAAAASPVDPDNTDTLADAFLDALAGRGWLPLRCASEASSGTSAAIASVRRLVNRHPLLQKRRATDFIRCT